MLFRISVNDKYQELWVGRDETLCGSETQLAYCSWLLLLSRPKSIVQARECNDAAEMHQKGKDECRSLLMTHEIFENRRHFVMKEEKALF